jgi:hypothetical protein
MGRSEPHSEGLYMSDCAVSTEMRASIRNKAAIKVKKKAAIRSDELCGA